MARPGTVRVSETLEQTEPVHLGVPVVRLRCWRWLLALVSVALGALGAFSAACVRLGFRGLEWVLTQSAAAEPLAAEHLPPWRRICTPVLGGLLAAAVLSTRRWRARRLGREPRPYVDYVEAVRHRAGCIPLVPNCWRTASAAFSVASGAAVGREGSMIQFAGALCSRCVLLGGGWVTAERLGLASRSGRAEGTERQEHGLALLVALGVAGGVTTAYNAPFASIFFVAEIVLGGLDWRSLPMLGLASAAGWVVAGEMLGFGRLYPVRVPLPADFAAWAVLPFLAVGFGVLGPGYQRLIKSLRAAKGLPLALASSGLLVGLLSWADPRVWGNGDLGLEAALGIAAGHGKVPGLVAGVGGLGLLLALRLLATSLCVGTGTVGGVFTPTLFAGGAVGALLGHVLLPGEAALGAVVGMSCLMAAVTHAPCMAACMAVELTGNWKLLPILLALNAISWGLARRISPEALYALASPTPGDGGKRGAGRATENAC